MLNTQLKPVTLFKSTDEGAPVLSASAGSLKALLKACLVTGYGNKTALGWEMPFEDANNAAFRSKSPESSRYFLKINQPQTRTATVQAFRAMTLLTAGSGEFGYTGNYQKFSFVESGRNQQDNWWLIGHDGAFVLIVGANHQNDAVMLFFGDVPSVVPNDTGNCLILHSSSNSYDYFNSSTFSFVGSGGNKTYIGKRWDNSELGAECELHSLLSGGSLGDMAYPDKITGGLSASEIYVFEKNNGLNLRGLLSGIFKTAHNLQDLPNGTSVVLDGTSDVFLKFRVGYSGSSNYYLINATQWEVNG